MEREKERDGKRKRKRRGRRKEGREGGRRGREEEGRRLGVFDLSYNIAIVNDCQGIYRRG